MWVYIVWLKKIYRNLLQFGWFSLAGTLSCAVKWQLQTGVGEQSSEGEDIWSPAGKVCEVNISIVIDPEMFDEGGAGWQITTCTFHVMNGSQCNILKRTAVYACVCACVCVCMCVTVNRPGNAFDHCCRCWNDVQLCIAPPPHLSHTHTYTHVCAGSEWLVVLFTVQFWTAPVLQYIRQTSSV